MFWHIFKYRVKQLFRTKDLIMWTMLFPVILGTMFYLAFGHLINTDEEESLKAIPIALVSSERGNTELEKVISEMSKEEADQLFILTRTDEANALRLLEEKEISAVIYSEKPSVTFSESGLNQTIVKTFLEQYLQKEFAIKEILLSHPENLQDAIALLTEHIAFSTEVTLTKNQSADPMSQYFYALIAMACLYAANIGLHSAIALQANLSVLAARRQVAPTHKLKVIIAELCAALLVNYLSILLLIFYLTMILGVDLGDKTALILVTGFFGSLLGITLGSLIGSIGKGGIEKKTAITMAICMLCSFLSGLMFNLMKGIIEHYFPLLNRINPAALITDALYSLYMYDTYGRFIKSIVLMGIMIVIFSFSSYLLLRRNKYASI